MTKFKGFPPMSANFTPVPNAFFDYVLPHCQPCVISVVGAIIRATVGWTDSVTGEKRIEAELSVPDIARLARISQNSVRKGVRLALEEGLLVETAAAGLNTGARYALKWENGEHQKEAIERSRRATGDFPAPPSTFEGAPPSTFAPPSKVEPLINKNVSKDIYIKTKKALNVDAREKRLNEARPEPERSTLNARGKGIHAVRDRAVEEIVALTGDKTSRRRFQQLWEVAEGNQSLDAWEAALRATQRRLRANAKQGLDRPGAYFDAICIKELEKREVFLPTSAEKQAEGDVAQIIRQGLFGIGDEPFDLSHLEREGGEALAEFERFVTGQRESYRSELATLGASAKERLLSAFDRPEKRKELFRKWKGDQAARAAAPLRGATLSP